MDSFNFSPVQIAQYFTCTIDREAGDSITHLKLQKLLYYAQAWSMVVLNKSLFKEDFEAWMHGPVLPSVWESYKKYGFDALPVCACDNDLPENILKLLEDIKSVYGEKSAKYLEELTHSETPWKHSRNGTAPEARSTKAIPKEIMFTYYQQLQENVNGH